MKYYVISIENENSERWKNFVNQPSIKNVYHKLQKIGVKGNDLTVAEYFKLAVAGKLKPLTPGELGCTLSHLTALNNFIQSDHDYALILEDDAIEVSYIDLINIEKKIVDLKLPQNFLFSLGGIQMKICDRVRGYELEKKLHQHKILKVDNDFLDRFAYAYAYVVDRQMANLLLNYHQEPKTYDHWSGLISLNKYFSIYATYVFDHPIVASYTFSSHLEADRMLVKHNKDTKVDIYKYVRIKLKKLFLAKFNLS